MQNDPVGFDPGSRGVQYYSRSRQVVQDSREKTRRGSSDVGRGTHARCVTECWGSLELLLGEDEAYYAALSGTEHSTFDRLHYPAASV